MKTWIAFFRGINVGGSNILPMKDLATLFNKLGFSNVRTYIQSGNVVFQSSEAQKSGLEKQTSAAVLENFGFQPQILFLELKNMEEAITSNPFPQAKTDPKSLHLYFLAKLPANPNFDSLQRIKTKTEAFALKEKVFYLHAPDGIGRSKLGAQAEKLLGVQATARNWRTVRKVYEMAKHSQ